MRAINKIIIHCSDSPRDRGDTAETIHDWHKRGNGWAGIGYHFVVTGTGKLEMGRPEYWAGAHVAGHNKDSIGICLIGRAGEASDEQLMTLKSLIDGLLFKYPDSSVDGHRDYDAKKTCPGFDVRHWLETGEYCD